ncbi:MAG: hypothetical protein AB8G05_23720 [Oligoflexales bacterium]
MLKFLLLFSVLITGGYACGPGSMGMLSTTYGPSVPYHISKGLVKNSIPNKEIDADLNGIISEFRKDLDLHKVSYDSNKFNLLKVVTVVSELPKTYHEDSVAICRKVKKKNTGLLGKTSYSWLEIKIDQKSYEKYKIADDNKLKILLYHELGHCILDLHHLPNNSIGIMSANIAKIKDPQNFSSYVDKMFTPVDTM